MDIENDENLRTANLIFFFGNFVQKKFHPASLDSLNSDLESLKPIQDEDKFTF